jgi:hypothetical protein
MRCFLKLLLVVVIGIAALGYYLDWFEFSKTSTDTSSTIHLKVDREKIREDEEHARDRLEEGSRRLKDKATGTIDRIKKESGRVPPSDADKP